MNYYNEIDDFAADWLDNLIDAGLIPAGHVDRRSIKDVRPEDLDGYTQCHFFAGISGWPYALELAGWPATESVWTGSCPCQPFSPIGQHAGFDDRRHLWPVWRRLIAERTPPVVCGEQVAGKAGRRWLARVRADLEDLGYAVGGADLCAAGVGAPHVRQRLYWVAQPPGAEAPRGQPRVVPDAWTPHETWIGADQLAFRVAPGAAALVDGIPESLGRVSAYGNAIVPQLAAEFIAAYLEARAA